MKVKNNWVAVELGKKNNATKSGIVIRETSTDNTQPITATILAVCDKLTYNKKEYERIQSIHYKERTPVESHRLAEINSWMPHDTDIEVQVGDVVYIDRNTERFQSEIEGVIFIPYFKIICKEDFTPVNGYVLIEPIEEVPAHEKGGIYILPKKLKGVGKVRYEGRPLRSYLYFGDKDYEESLIGKLVHFRNTIGYKIEHDFYNKTGQVLIPVQRKDILWTFEN